MPQEKNPDADCMHQIAQIETAERKNSTTSVVLRSIDFVEIGNEGKFFAHLTS